MTLPQDLIQRLKDQALNIRVNIIKSGFNCKAPTHYASSLSCVEILTYLYSHLIKQNNELITNKFILSKGHAALALYSCLKEFNYISQADLLTYNLNGSHISCQGTYDPQIGIEMSSGSLGMGLSFAIGKALAFRKQHQNNRKIYVLLGNGECNEGMTLEALMFIGAHNLKQIYIIVDQNAMQLDGKSSSVLEVKSWQNLFAGFGIKAFECDGHNFNSLNEAFTKAQNTNEPCAIIANTIKGKGVSFMENNNDWHHKLLDKEQYEKAVALLEGQSYEL